MPSSTPRQLIRETERIEGARRLSRSLYEANADQIDIAHACGVPRQLVQRWCSVHHRDLPSATDLRLMPRSVVERFVSWLLEPHGLDIVPAASETRSPTDLHSLHEVVARSTAVTTAHLSAIADGHISDSELAELALKLTQSIGAQQELLNGIRDEIRNREQARHGSTPLRKVGP